jgi:hypothetical protein
VSLSETHAIPRALSWTGSEGLWSMPTKRGSKAERRRRSKAQDRSHPCPADTRPTFPPTSIGKHRRFLNERGIAWVDGIVFSTFRRRLSRDSLDLAAGMLLLSCCWLGLAIRRDRVASPLRLVLPKSLEPIRGQRLSSRAWTVLVSGRTSPSP